MHTPNEGKYHGQKETFRDNTGIFKYLMLGFITLFIGMVFLLPALLRPGFVVPCDYMFNRQIKWPDKSREHVVIGNDGYFILNGERRRLVGMTLGSGLSHDKGECYWLPENVQRWDKILTFLAESGVRIVSFEPESIYHYGGEAGEELERYSSLFDLIYEHKMLVMPHFVARHQPDAGDLSEPDFILEHSHGEDTVGMWARRFSKVMARYPNVVAIVVGNELNIPMGSYDYSPENVAAYLEHIGNIVKSEVNVPVVTSFAGHSENPAPVRDDIVLAGLGVTDWPCFTIYGDSLELYEERLVTLTTWLADNGYAYDGYWIKETNYYSWAPPDAGKFSVEYLDIIFSRGASVALLYAALSPDDPRYSFFDSKGYPIESMQQLASHIPQLQRTIANRDG